MRALFTSWMTSFSLAVSVNVEVEVERARYWTSVPVGVWAAPIWAKAADGSPAKATRRSGSSSAGLQKRALFTTPSPGGPQANEKGGPLN